MSSLSVRLLLFFLTFGLVALGCKKDEATAPAAPTFPTQLVGTWVPTSATLNGQQAALSTVFQWVQGAVGCGFAITAQGTYTYVEIDANQQELYNCSGSVTISGSNITVTVTAVNGQQQQSQTWFAGTWALTGNQLTITSTLQNQPLVVVMTKA